MSNVITMGGDRIDQAVGEDVIVFQNQGEIDIRALTTMGISAKQEGSIGFFGTGLKYAIAVLLREGQEVTIYSGLRAFEFSLGEITFRDKTFLQCQMDEVHLGDLKSASDLPFTTELGKTWEMWQAYRELHCNTTDEQGQITRVPEERAAPKEGYTTIVVKGDKFLQAYEERSKVILETPVHRSYAQVDVHRGSSEYVYYKNVRVYQCKPSIATYNLKGHVDLTEDRTVKYWWHARAVIINAVLMSDDEAWIKAVLTAGRDTFEGGFNFLDRTEATATPSKTFIEVAEGLPPDTLNNSARGVVEQWRMVTGEFVSTVPLSSTMQAQLNKAMDFTKKMGYDIMYPIVVVDTFGQNVLGMAKNDTIYLSTRVFSFGTKKMVGVILEEYWHLKHDLEDETREMQNFLFEKIVDMAAEYHKEVL